jgi:hypothetical protein
MFQDLIQDHFTAADQAAFDAAVATLESLLQPKLRNLSEDENNEIGFIDEKNKLVVEKVNDYRDSQPALSSGDVDWVEFKADRFDRKFLETGAQRLVALATAMTETKRVHDFDNYQNSLVDYHYTEYKMGTSPGLGYDTKYNELKQFFTNP